MRSEIKLIRNSDFMLRDIAGEHILIPVGDAAIEFSGMITLNESGILLWNVLERECTVDDLTEIILNEYDVSREAAVRDIETFVSKMISVGIVKETK